MQRNCPKNVICKLNLLPNLTFRFCIVSNLQEIASIQKRKQNLKTKKSKRIKCSLLKDSAAIACMFEPPSPFYPGCCFNREVKDRGEIGGVSALSAGAYTTTFLVMIDRVKGRGCAGASILYFFGI